MSSLRPLYKKQNCLRNTVHSMQSSPDVALSLNAERMQLWDCSFLPFPSNPTSVFTKSNGACERELGFSTKRSLGHAPLIIVQAQRGVYRIVLQYHGAVFQEPTQKVTATLTWIRGETCHNLLCSCIQLPKKITSRLPGSY